MIPSGQTDVDAFDTAATYTYCWVEHEGAGMTGRVIVAPEGRPGP